MSQQQLEMKKLENLGWKVGRNIYKRFLKILLQKTILFHLVSSAFYDLNNYTIDLPQDTQILYPILIDVNEPQINVKVDLKLSTAGRELTTMIGYIVVKKIKGEGWKVIDFKVDDAGKMKKM